MVRKYKKKNKDLKSYGSAATVNQIRNACCNILFIFFLITYIQRRHGRGGDRVVVGYTTIHAINVYHN